MKKFLAFILPVNGNQLAGAMQGIVAGLATVFLSQMATSQDSVIVIGLIIFLGHVNVPKSLVPALEFLMKIHQMGVILFTFINVYYLLDLNIFLNPFSNDLAMTFFSSLFLLLYFRLESFFEKTWIHDAGEAE